MRTLIKNILLTAVLAAFTTATVLPGLAADGEKKARPTQIPFHGKIKAVDKTGKTVTIDRDNKNTFAVTSETRITKLGKPATLDDAVVGEEVGGLAIEKDGKLELRSLRLGAKPDAEGKAKAKGKDKKDK